MKKHPIKKVRGRAYWFGPEVEGTLQNTPTVFVSRALTAKQMVAVLGQVPRQMFLTEDFKDWKWLKSIWKVTAGLIVTKACYPRQVRSLRDNFPWVRLFVRIRAPWALELHDADHISLGVPYDLVSVRMSHTIRTHPRDYESDYT